MRSGIATAGASSGFLLAYGLPREATNFAADVTLDLLDDGFVPADSQQIADDWLDGALNKIEDTLGLVQ